MVSGVGCFLFLKKIKNTLHPLDGPQDRWNDWVESPKCICFAPTMKKCVLLLAFAGLRVMGLTAQNDSTLLLHPERLTDADVRKMDFGSRDVKIVAATRSPENPNDLPFSTWVITSDDILRYGFVTLADVLKSAPGIRVSQPGNAVEGETFLIRGLSGNQYVKIMLDGIPLMPSTSLGMPIGAQLPIRQAERIEVIYGPMGMIYGNEACAGVVNIVLKQTERPIFTQADLSLGSLGYNSLDLTFGGKLFRDRNILQFSMYGSSTVRTNTDVYHDRTLYDMTNYLMLGLNENDTYLNNPNFQSDIFSLLPYLSPIGHESRLFGINMRWRGLQLMYNRMSRNDASFLGFNPMARSYSVRGSALNERIETYSLGFKKRWGRFETQNLLSVVNSRTSGTATFIFDQLNGMAYQSDGGASLSLADRALAIDQNFVILNERQRFASASSNDVRFESFGSLNLTARLRMLSGIQVGALLGNALESRNETPPENYGIVGFDNVEPIFSRLQVGFYSSAHQQFEWRGPRLRVYAGLCFDASALDVVPRVGVLYRPDSVLTLFANYSTGIDNFNFYQVANSFGATDNLPAYVGSASRVEGSIQRVRSSELGVRLGKSNVAMTDVTFFYQNAYNLIRNGQIITDVDNKEAFSGYYGVPNLGQRTWGIQSRLMLSASTSATKKDQTERVVTWRGEFYIQYLRGRERYDENQPMTSDLFNAPRWMTQFKSSGRSGRFQTSISSNRQTSVLSKSITYRDAWQRVTTLERYPTFRTWDVMLRFYLNKNFLMYCLATNVFNRNAYGLDAFGSPDDLLAPIQPGRQWRIGINYNMN
jgi:outer membrane receptor protein involved in Fe transport